MTAAATTPLQNRDCWLNLADTAAWSDSDKHYFDHSASSGRFGALLIG